LYLVRWRSFRRVHVFSTDREWWFWGLSCTNPSLALASERVWYFTGSSCLHPVLTRYACRVRCFSRLSCIDPVLVRDKDRARSFRGLSCINPVLVSVAGKTNGLTGRSCRNRVTSPRDTDTRVSKKNCFPWRRHRLWGFLYLLIFHLRLLYQSRVIRSRCTASNPFPRPFSSVFCLTVTCWVFILALYLFLCLLIIVLVWHFFPSVLTFFYCSVNEHTPRHHGRRE
jgi:hypothetical protein